VGPGGIFLSAGMYANSGSLTNLFPRVDITFDGGSASAQFNDQVIIFGPPQGFLDVTVFSLIVSHDGFGGANFSVGGVAVGQISGTPGFTTTLHVPFQSGQPISITGSVAGNANDFSPNNPNDGSSDITLNLSARSFTVFDINGHRDSDFSYLSMSGDQLPFSDGVFIPEPSTFLLLTTGLAVVLLVHRIHLLRRRATPATPAIPQASNI